MARIPVIIPQGPSGSANPSAANGRSIPQTGTSVGGPPQGHEQFNHPDVPPEVNRALNQIQQNVLSSTQQGRSDPRADGNYLSGVSFTGTAKILYHGLGRAYRGFEICNIRLPGAGTATAYQTPNASPGLDIAQITIVPQGTYTCDVWVY